MELVTCLEGIGYKQAIAMIDKRYKDHPEKWSNVMSEEILKALTAEDDLVKGKIR